MNRISSYIKSSSLFLAIMAGVACHQAAPPSPGDSSESLSAQDLAYVFAPTSSTGGFQYHGDGTPRSDSTVRIASVGMTSVITADFARGYRITHAAFVRGLPDQNFYHDYISEMRLTFRPVDEREACDALVKLFPADSADVRQCRDDMRAR